MLAVKKAYWETRGRVRKLRRILSITVCQFAIVARLFAAYLRFSTRGRRARYLIRNRNGEASNRLLVFSYYSPPYKSRYGTQRLTKFLKYLSRQGWRVTVVTTDPSSDDEVDQKAEPFPDTVREARIDAPEFPIYTEKAFWTPDSHIRWIGPALTRASQEFASEMPDVILATVPPYSNAIAAAVAATEYRIPLVVDFRDPWSQIDWGWVLSNRFSRWLTRRLECWILKMSARIVMADEAKYASEVFALAGGEMNDKIVSILNGYDEEDFIAHRESSRHLDETKFCVSYVGTVYDADTFNGIRALIEVWEKRHPADFSDVEIHYAGPNSAMFDLYGFRPPYLVDHGYVSHRDAVALRFESHVQVFILPAYFKPHVISGKIYEMVRTGVPIVAITNPAGSVATILAATRAGVVVDNRKPEEGVEAVHSLYVLAGL